MSKPDRMSSVEQAKWMVSTLAQHGRDGLAAARAMLAAEDTLRLRRTLRYLYHRRWIQALQPRYQYHRVRARAFRRRLAVLAAGASPVGRGLPNVLRHVALVALLAGAVGLMVPGLASSPGAASAWGALTALAAVLAFGLRTGEQRWTRWVIPALAAALVALTGFEAGFHLEKALRAPLALLLAAVVLDQSTLPDRLETLLDDLLVPFYAARLSYHQYRGQRLAVHLERHRLALEALQDMSNLQVVQHHYELAQVADLARLTNPNGQSHEDE